MTRAAATRFSVENQPSTRSQIPVPPALDVQTARERLSILSVQLGSQLESFVHIRTIDCHIAPYCPFVELDFAALFPPPSATSMDALLRQQKAPEEARPKPRLRAPASKVS